MGQLPRRKLMFDGKERSQTIDRANAPIEHTLDTACGRLYHIIHAHVYIEDIWLNVRY